MRRDGMKIKLALIVFLSALLTFSACDDDMENIPLSQTIPESQSTEPGDLILYQGNSLVIFYAPNTWNYTRLGRINDITQDELKDILGSGNVTVTLSL
jgi:hypothetical protein